MFFSYANTVATIDFAKQFKGHGWLELVTKLSLMKIITKLLFTFDSKKQMSACTRNTWYFGVNLIYGAITNTMIPNDCCVIYTTI
jgi:phosphotransferase system  glucose/maltose/N-acetylglucosamine-specific IIC component